MNLAYLEGLIGADAVTAAWTLAKILAITVPIILSVAYLTLAERKVIGYMQVRIGPNRVGYRGLLQPFADVLKLLVKEIIIPSGANKTLQARVVPIPAGECTARISKAASTNDATLLGPNGQNNCAP